MGSGGRAWVMLWVVGALFAAMLTGLGSRSFSANEVDNQASVHIVSDVPDNSEGDNGGEEAQLFHGGAIVLDRSEDGHFYADAEVNGQTIRMLVDTGATAIALSRGDARRAGIGISIGMPEVVGQGASGDVHGEVVTIERIALGNTEAEDFDAVVLDQGETSLLGQTFLAKFDSVEIKGDKMVLK